jgi:hypothetical protein
VIKVETPHFIYQFNSDNEAGLALFQVLETRIGPPSLAQVVEASVHVSTKIVEPGIC